MCFGGRSRSNMPEIASWHSLSTGCRHSIWVLIFSIFRLGLESRQRPVLPYASNTKCKPQYRYSCHIGGPFNSSSRGYLIKKKLVVLMHLLSSLKPFWSDFWLRNWIFPNFAHRKGFRSASIELFFGSETQLHLQDCVRSAILGWMGNCTVRLKGVNRETNGNWEKSFAPLRNRTISNEGNIHFCCKIAKMRQTLRVFSMENFIYLLSMSGLECVAAWVFTLFAPAFTQNRNGTA